MLFLIISWAIIIFILLCTTPAFAVLGGDLQFGLAADPNWSSFFGGEVSRVEFAGHFILFFVLAALLKEIVPRASVVFVIAVLYGFAIELVQPFFGRGAELVDVVANVVGIIAFLVLEKVYKMIRNVLRAWNT